MSRAPSGARVPTVAAWKSKPSSAFCGPCSFSTWHQVESRFVLGLLRKCGWHRTADRDGCIPGSRRYTGRGTAVPRDGSGGKRGWRAQHPLAETAQRTRSTRYGLEEYLLDPDPGTIARPNVNFFRNISLEKCRSYASRSLVHLSVIVFEIAVKFLRWRL